jgi:tripartite-type tricarboxylate transporter receptor subunit TctC
VPNYIVTTWYGILAPAGTPRDIINRLNAEWIKIEAQQDTKDKMAAAGYDPMSSTPDQFADFIKSEMVSWMKVIKDANIKIEQ